MKECRVLFENDLSLEDVRAMVEMFQKLKGVKQVFWDEGKAEQNFEERKKVESPLFSSTEKTTTGNSTYNFGGIKEEMEDLESLALREAEKNDPSRFKLDANKDQKNSFPLDLPGEDLKLNTLSQRHAINYALKWALQNGHISAKQLESLKPEEIVKLALGIITELPEVDKKKLGKELSGMGVTNR